MSPLVFSCCATANPLGSSCAVTFAALRESRSGLRPNDFDTAALETWIGRVDGLEHERVTGRLAEFDCRNNRLAQLGLRQDGFEDAVAQKRERYGAHRIAVLIGTSTSGAHETELAYRRRDRSTGALPPDLCYRYHQNIFSVADFVRRYGESSDGYHMSAPHPEGAGVHLAVTQALSRAGLAPNAIDYINLHGTATPANDRAEDLALHRIFGDAVPCSSTKGWTGHTLGAAGVTEAIISALCLEHSWLPGTLNTRTLDPSLRSRIVLSGESHPLRHVLSNSFGFGGNNCSLVLGMRA